MKAHRKWLSGHEIKTVGYLNNDDAYNAGTEAGWRAALEWAKDEGICSGDSCVSSQFQVCGVKEVIEQELEGK